MFRSLILSLALVASASPAVADTALTGNWQLKIVSPQGTRTPVMLLTQTGGDVTGTYKSSRGDAPIAGTANGNQFTLTVKLGSGDNILVAQFKGQVDGNNLQGMVMMGQRGDVPFTGTRAP